MTVGDDDRNDEGCDLMVVGAHAMDAELLGGALAAHVVKQGGSAHLLHLTRGERGHPTLDANAFATQLESEMEAAGRMLGTSFRWAGVVAPLADADEGQLSDLVLRDLREVRPSFVLTHWIGSWHPGHVRAHTATRAAIAACREAGQEVDLLYGENCEDLLGFVPIGFADVSSGVEDWRRAVRAYELFRRSEPDSGVDALVPYASYYEAALRVRGLHAGFDRAQAVMPGPWPISVKTRKRFKWLEPPQAA
jgi:LmbE family N-acetylglucosaminyl deacetylase